MQESIKVINIFLQNLEKGTVVGMDGYSGIGKTTISNIIGEINPNIKIIHMDDYVVTSNTKENLEPQLDIGNKELKLEWTNVEVEGLEKLKKDIKENKNNIVLVEGIFFSHPDVLSGVFDKLIFIDGDEELADKRRIAREKERWGNKYFPETHPDSYARLFKLAWGKYIYLYKPKEKSDFVVGV